MRQKKYKLAEAIKLWPENDRPREKFVSSGPSSLSDSELLAILIGSGTGSKNALDLARDVLREFDDLAGIETASLEEIQRIRGIGMAKAVSIKAGLELGRRFAAASKSPVSGVIRTSEDVANMYIPMMKNYKKEKFMVALLNAKNRLIKTVTISEGGLTGVSVEPREVFNPAIRESAHAVILMHNHPSGEPEPSDDDINITRRMVEAGRLINIRIIDHIIFGENRYYSMADHEEL